jgi:hypothetical protein
MAEEESMFDQQKCNHDVEWGSRTWSAATFGRSATAAQIKEWITTCFNYSYESDQIEAALLHGIQRGTIRANGDGTCTWLGAAAA